MGEAERGEIITEPEIQVMFSVENRPENSGYDGKFEGATGRWFPLPEVENKAKCQNFICVKTWPCVLSFKAAVKASV